MNANAGILVVEDDPSLFRFWNRFLKTIPCGQYKILSSPVEALQVAKEFKPHILVTDLSMPGMNGIELIQAVHAIAPDTRMVITSGFIENTRPLADAGIFAHVVKKPYLNLEHLKEFFTLLLKDADEITRAHSLKSQGAYYWDL